MTKFSPPKCHANRDRSYEIQVYILQLPTWWEIFHWEGSIRTACNWLWSLLKHGFWPTCTAHKLCICICSMEDSTAT